MEQALSRRIALALLAATSAEEVQAVIDEEEATYYFGDPQHWSPYGNREKNWDTVGNQQTNPIGAFVELITNGIDTTLLRHAREAGITDFRSPDAPQSMFEAVKRFFPSVNEGKISKLSPEERTALATKCLMVAVQRGVRKNHTYPTYTIVDFGDGQLPQDFPKTFLSLSEKNKEGIPFVQGKFNMGSTGSLRFCTRSDIRLGHYKFIISRRPGQQFWGWTLIRVRGPRAGEALPVAEYFHVNRAVIPKFSHPQLNAFGHDEIGLLTEGTAIRVYEYDIGPEARAVDLGLYNALTVNLVECALPVQLYDFNAKPVDGKGALRRQGIAARTFSGLNVVLRAEEAESKSEEPDASEVPIASDAKSSDKPLPAKTEWVHEVCDVRDEELGRFRIVATAVTRLPNFLNNQPARIFYTINGQTHAFERASFLNTRIGLPDLRNHLLVNVICDDMNKQALATIFMPDRERKANNDLSRRLEKKVIEELKSDDRLRAYAAEIRLRRASQHIEDKEETKDLLKELVKSDPAIRELFGLGQMLPDVEPAKGGTAPFKGKRVPTFLHPLNLRKEGDRFVKELPIGGFRRIECGTDAADEYLTRLDSPGETWCSADELTAPHSVKLRNGVARFTLYARSHANIGDEVEVEFGFRDYVNIEPLKFAVRVRYVAEEKKADAPSGKDTQSKPKFQLRVGEPNFPWVNQAEWADHNFDENSGAYVSVGDEPSVYVNRDNRHLKNMRAREKDDAARALNEHMFRYGLGILALAIHKRADDAAKATRADGEAGQTIDAELATRIATAGMAPYISTVIRKLGGADAL